MASFQKCLKGKSVAAVTKRGTRGRGDEGTRGRGDEGTRGRGDEGTRGRGDEGTRGRGDEGTRGRGDAGRGTWEVGTRGRDKQTTPHFCNEFVKYNFRCSRAKCFTFFQFVSGQSSTNPAI